MVYYVNLIIIYICLQLLFFLSSTQLKCLTDKALITFDFQGAVNRVTLTVEILLLYQGIVPQRVQLEFK